MEKKLKIVMGIMTLLCPPVGLITWIREFELLEDHQDTQEKIFTDGIQKINDILEKSKNPKGVA